MMQPYVWERVRNSTCTSPLHVMLRKKEARYESGVRGESYRLYFQAQERSPLQRINLKIRTDRDSNQGTHREDNDENMPVGCATEKIEYPGRFLATFDNETGRRIISVAFAYTIQPVTLIQMEEIIEGRNIRKALMLLRTRIFHLPKSSS